MSKPENLLKTLCKIRSAFNCQTEWKEGTNLSKFLKDSVIVV